MFSLLEEKLTSGLTGECEIRHIEPGSTKNDLVVVRLCVFFDIEDCAGVNPCSSASGSMKMEEAAQAPTTLG